MAVLQKRIGQHPEFVFSYRGEPITNVSTKAWWAALKRAGINDFRWHDLRTRSQRGTGRRERPRTNCRCSAGG